VSHRHSTRQGCRELAGALAHRTGQVLAVAGSPITHLAELLETYAAGFEWAFNEKCAVEAAVGLSAVGARSCVVVKHNGFTLALDSLSNAAAHGIGAALVVVVGDDPDACGSTTVQDSRLLAAASRLPVLEPALDGDAQTVVDEAVRISEQYGTPVLVRITSALHRGCTSAQADQLPPTPAVPVPETALRVDLDRAHGLTKLGRAQHQRLVTLPRTTEDFGSPVLADTRCGASWEEAAVAVGAAAAHAPVLGGCRLTLRTGWPLPPAVADFAQRHRRVWVLEEGAPLLEDHLRAAVGAGTEVLGRRTGHLPPDGSLDEASVKAAPRGPYPSAWQTPDRKTAVAPPGRYDTLFTAIARLSRQGVFVAADVGSAVRLCYPPYSAADVALALGSAAAVAGGAARTGRRSIGVIGDFALLHSSVEPLLEAVQHNLPTLTVVLANKVQAQTGGQPVPPLPLAALIKACGVQHIDQWMLDALDVDATGAKLDKLLAGPLPAAAIVHAPHPGTP
jgi:indolepyruvate ferredoxin oxidoreductase alpha subunit